MEDIKIGDILAGTHGWTMTIPHFYMVVGKTEKRLKVVKMGHRMVSHDGYGQQGYEMPGEIDLDEKPKLARLDKWGSWVVGSKYDTEYMNKWNGKPIWADYMD